MPAPNHTDSELSDFLLKACHDLRGPLRTMRIHAELLNHNRAAGVSQDSEQSLAFVASGAMAAAALVDGIADYALALAIDASRFQFVPLDVMLRGAMAKLAAQIRETDTQVLYSELPSVMGDADRLLQLFEYLLDHSLRRRGSNRLSIRISAELQNDAWLLTIRDDGPALAADPPEKAFTPFARLHGNQRPGPGLATCLAIVARHGGRLWAESLADGCVLRFTLPQG
jgi:light-regulated signal transduction histidine kinase (bacteriophytochrome)